MAVTRKHRDKLGLMLFGGYGSNVSHWLINNINPEEYEDLELFVANTDASVQYLHFGQKDNESQKLWRNRLTFHLLGGKEVTNGRGAGADPAVGKKAAETEFSMKAMRAFMKRQNVIKILSGLGGGTGTGAAPVAARLAKDEFPDLSISAMVTMPYVNEGGPRQEAALKALRAIQRAGVTTFPIWNEAVNEFTKNYAMEERRRLTHAMKHQIINENTIYPWLLGLREVIQIPADVMNRDLADWGTFLGYGKHGFTNLANIKSPDVPVEDILKQVLYGPFNDIGIVREATALFFWSHGPWPAQLLDDTINGVTEEASKDRPREKIEIYQGINNRVTDEKLWILVAAVSSKLPKAEVIPKGGWEMKTIPPVGRYPLQCRFNGEPKEVLVSAAVQKRYNKTMADTGASVEDMEKVLKEIAPYSDGIVPDLPGRFKVPTEVPRRRLFRLG